MTNKVQVYITEQLLKKNIYIRVLVKVSKYNFKNVVNNLTISVNFNHLIWIAVLKINNFSKVALKLFKSMTNKCAEISTKTKL